MRIIILSLFCMAFTCSPLDSEEYFDYQQFCDWGYTIDDIAAPDMSSPGVKPSGAWGWYYFFIIDSVIYEGEVACRYRTHGVEHSPEGEPLAPCHVNGLAVWSFQLPYYFNPVSESWTHADYFVGEQPVYKQGDTVSIRANVIEGNITWWN